MIDLPFELWKRRKVPIADTIWHKNHKRSDSQKEFTDMCAKWIALDNRPMQIVEDKGFISVIESINPKIRPISRRAVLNRLNQLELEIDSKREAELCESKYVACTSDVWTDISTNSYASVTAHFVSKDWKLESLLLTCSKIPGSHTGRALAKFMIQVGKKYKILKKLTFIIADNASSAKSQVRLSAQQEAIFFEARCENEEPGSSDNPSSKITAEAVNAQDIHALFDGALEGVGDAQDLREAISGNELEAIIRDAYAETSHSELLVGKQSTVSANSEMQATLNRMPCSAHTL